ncbi:MAG: class I SAM-dependent methyltransferase [Deltaproteobacteria bacterium]|nr:class I SAM-dependent methyltransferase [Deltaproteobacteria bacterium]
MKRPNLSWLVKFIKNMARYNTIYFRNKFYDLSIRQAILSSLDRRRLQEKYPSLTTEYETRAHDYELKLQPYYEYYTKHMSNEIMTISMELSTFLLLMCNERRPGRILDLGSGFSSFVFLFYKSSEKQNTTVWSVDDSSEWLNKTRGFLDDHGMPSDHLLTWDDFIQKGEGSFDLILYDIGTFEFRHENFEKVTRMKSPGGVIVIDDVHQADYGIFINRKIQEIGLTSYDTGCLTRDKFRRFSLLVTA